MGRPWEVHGSAWEVLGRPWGAIGGSGEVLVGFPGSIGVLGGSLESLVGFPGVLGLEGLGHPCGIPGRSSKVLGSSSHGPCRLSEGAQGVFGGPWGCLCGPCGNGVSMTTFTMYLFCDVLSAVRFLDGP